MRIYFNLANGTHRIPDLEGIEATDVEDARREAEQAVLEMLSEDPALQDSVGGWRLEVFDAAGVLLFTLSLSAVTH